jgi:hypothetical protein
MAGPVEVTHEKVEPTRLYRASSISLYGVPFSGSDCLVGLGSNSGEVCVTCSANPAFGQWLAALIYGYSYQGHVYSLPEPVIMLVDDSTKAVANDAGYGNLYTRWTADKLDRTAQLLLTNDTFEELLLKRSIGESRQPMSYHAAMAISHRGGKLMD